MDFLNYFWWVLNDASMAGLGAVVILFVVAMVPFVLLSYVAFKVLGWDPILVMAGTVLGVMGAGFGYLVVKAIIVLLAYETGMGALL